ncbi:hypothetical protein [Salinarimonas sp.]|uniref:head-tail joining protein n=1 Tax=Salinarimonas sp. TaxID=2766526 RepID=UPI00391B1A66
MSVDFERMLAPMMDAFAREVTYTAPGGEPVARRGVFDRDHQRAFDGNGVYHSAAVSKLGIRLSEWSPRPAHRGVVVVPGEGTYTIHDIEADAEGAADLILRKVS